MWKARNLPISHIHITISFFITFWNYRLKICRNNWNPQKSSPPAPFLPKCKIISYHWPTSFIKHQYPKCGIVTLSIFHTLVLKLVLVYHLRPEIEIKLEGRCYRLNLCPHSQFICWNLIPMVVVFGSGDFGT